MFLAKKINKRVSQLCHALSGRSVIDHEELRSIIHDTFKPFGAKTVIVKADVPKNALAIGGYFEPHRIRQPITIELFLSERFDKIRLNKRDLPDTLFVLFQTICHELIHKYQYQHRDPNMVIWYCELDDHADMTEEQVYLAEMDEIDAYAHDIALELMRFYPKTYMDEMHWPNPAVVTSWGMYKAAFEGTEWSDIRKQLLKKVYQHAINIRDRKEQYTCTTKSTH